MKNLLKTQWQSLSAAKRGRVVGFGVGILWAAFAAYTSVVCQWNFLQGHMPVGVCENEVVQYVFGSPIIWLQIPVALLLGLLLGLLPNLENSVLDSVFVAGVFGVPIIVVVLVLTRTGAFLGQLMGKGD